MSEKRDISDVGRETVADEKAVPSTDFLQTSIMLKDEETPPLTKGVVILQSPPPLGGEGDEGRRNRVIPSTMLFDMIKGSINDSTGQLWGYNIRPKAVTLLVGETSAGKTTFLHNLAYHLAKGEEFLGLQPPRPLRVLYLDYESGNEIIAEHFAAIGTAEGWDFFDLEDSIRGADLTKVLSEEIQRGQYEVVIMDSLMEAYPVHDENDNSEGTKQMLTVRKIAQDTGAAIVAVHNAGQKALAKKKKSDLKNLARGATARMDKADVVLNYTINGPKDSDERALEVVKSRGRNLNAKIVVRFAGDLGFEVVTNSAASERVVKKMETDVLAVLGHLAAEGEPEVSRGTVLLRLGVDKDDRTHAQAVDRALRILVSQGRVRKIKQGVYATSNKAAAVTDVAA